MPEVVEVCLTAMYLTSELEDRKIVRINVVGGRYSRSRMAGLDELDVELPIAIRSVDSKGKFMWFELERDKYILTTMGLEGKWGFTKQKHSGVEFVIDDGRVLYFTDSRNFGTLGIHSGRDALDDKLNKLAPDFLKTGFTDIEFLQRIRDYESNKPKSATKKIIAILMDQEALGSGLGNYLAIEALYQSKISPHMPLKNINNRLGKELSKSIKMVTKLSYLTSDTGYFSKMEPEMLNYVKRVRNEILQDKNHKFNFHPGIDLGDKKFNFLIYRKKSDPCGNPVVAEKIIPGRTTYWVPTVQIYK